MKDIAEKTYSDSQLNKIQLMIGTPEEFQEMRGILLFLLLLLMKIK